MALLLDDLLDVARITQRKLDLRKQNVNLVGIVDQAIETARPSIDAKSHALTVSLPPGDVVLHVDPLRLSQVISNLLTNAAKYTDPGGAINLCGTVDGNDLNIAVSDDGIGIAPEFLERIFEWFSQARNGASRSEGGLGIGLALVKGLVKLHGGTITAHSDGPGRGSRFSVHLPCAVIRSGAIPDVGHKTEAVATARRRVMVVDDNADAADSLRELLEMSGHEVCVAHGGHAALSLAESYRPDVVLLDIGMPDMDGCEAAAALRRTPWGSRMRLIALTGLGQESDRRRTQQAGFDSHLTKPVHLDDVMPLLAGQ
jgi:CheY-like chemotaxis protein/two-component sensor histidine kinase